MSNAQSPKSSTPSSPLELIGFPGHEITWAGECPWTGGLCFATEGGKLLIPSAAGSVGIYDLVSSDAVVNGVAFGGANLLAASTPGEVVFFQRDHRDGQLRAVGTSYDGGAHDVITTGAGGFVAPLGINGLLLLELLPDGHWRKRVARMPESDFYFYQIARLGQWDGRDVYACALRVHGLLGTTLPSGADAGSGLTHCFEGLDVISVCSLGHPEWPFAAAGLGRDRTILLCRNVLDKHPPLTLHFDLLTGTGYSIRCVQGHVVILTSRSVFVLPELGSRFLSGESLEVPLTVATCPFGGVEIYSAFDRWLLVEEPEGVLRLELDELLGFANGPGADQRPPVRGEPPWDAPHVLDLPVAALV